MDAERFDTLIFADTGDSAADVRLSLQQVLVERASWGLPMRT